MHYYEVAPNKIIRIDSDSFTYSSDKNIPIGSLVDIEIGKKKMVGVIICKSKEPTYSTKPILSIIEHIALPIQLIELAKWMAGYYSTPLATVLQTMLPKGLRTVRRAQDSSQNIVKRERTNILFNDEQNAAVSALTSSVNGTYLLQGVTGSGKTEVYIKAVKHAVLNGKSAIILVPEIALTSQLLSEFSSHFDNLLITHSQMSESKRHIVWREALNSTSPKVVIGPRSALFTPLPDIGIIIVDEAHEPGYKQEQAPKYSALRVATMLGRYHNCKVVFGSATPSISDRYLAEKSNKKILKLTKVARTGSEAAEISLVDMTKRTNFTKHRFLSDKLLNQIEQTLKIGKQILIFHNRRGSASTVICKNCGWTALCPKCYIPLTLHADKNRLFCHICGHSAKTTTTCPTCGNADIIYKGIGTKLVESEIKKLFPTANIARFDADNSDKETVNNRYQELYDGTIDIAIGTQVIAKGLDLPNLRTVGVIQADTGLSLPDYVSNERTFQLLAQVIGRVGRNEQKTNVVVQSYQPNHPSIVFGLKQDYESFYQNILAERKLGLFPPFTHLLKLTCIYKSENAAIKNAKKLAINLKKAINSNVQILGPTPAFYERQNDTFRWQLVLKSPKREFLIQALSLLPTSHWQSELDPTSLL